MLALGDLAYPHGTFADFARSRGPGLVPPEALAGAIDRIAALPVPTVGGGQPPTQSAN